MKIIIAERCEDTQMEIILMKHQSEWNHKFGSCLKGNTVAVDN